MTALQNAYRKLLDGKLVFDLMIYFDYESPVWDALLDQLSLAEGISWMRSGVRYRPGNSNAYFASKVTVTVAETQIFAARTTVGESISASSTAP